jgi:hypothetical protein
LAEQHRDDVELDKDAYLRPTTSVVRLRQGVSLTCESVWEEARVPEVWRCFSYDYIALSF